ncbi:unnamed protein product, partial [Symbiodinium necroappetens]
VASLQENGLTAASIRRVEELLAALDRHQEQGTGPEARWELSRLVARMESCAETLEALMEVLHRRLVPRGFLPVQRMPATIHDQQRFYQWVSQYNTLCVDAIVRNMEAPLQTDEVESNEVPDAGPPVSVEQPSSSSGPAPASLLRSRSRSRTRGSSVPSSSTSLVDAEESAEPAVPVDDPEAAQMLEATLRGTPPVLPSWARPGLTPSERPGLWREDPPPGTDSLVDGLATEDTSTPSLTRHLCAFIEQHNFLDYRYLAATVCAGEHFDQHNFLDYKYLATTVCAGEYYVLDYKFLATTVGVGGDVGGRARSLGQLYRLMDVFYNFDNIAILAGGADRVQVLQRLLERQRTVLLAASSVSGASFQCGWHGEDDLAVSPARGAVWVGEVHVFNVQVRSYAFVLAHAGAPSFHGGSVAAVFSRDSKIDDCRVS